MPQNRLSVGCHSKTLSGRFQFPNDEKPTIHGIKPNVRSSVFPPLGFRAVRANKVNFGSFINQSLLP